MNSVAGLGRRSRLRGRAVARIAGVIVLVGTLTSCGQAPQLVEPPRTEPGQNQPEKTGAGELREDLTPVLERFPQLPEAVSIHWMSGTLGDARTPGPRSYWIDAVIALSPAEYDALQADAVEVSASSLDGLSPGLRDVVPSGAVLGSERLDDRFAQPGFSTEAYLIADSDVLVLMTVFQ
ncbi:hypothetical protein G7067_11035 [Leucobacter insecticola]|uniref:Uncharacterized protein n=1 Tax=Leucobacter insecticola TaxID=2714934 RepID=A0A6G8FKK1_9MICO|nr:hypothetical protein [Leucobacter insecticola]QIM16813.1 hypothetical protein G7067_11035 [Leucobacter insecticola]